MELLAKFRMNYPYNLLCSMHSGDTLFSQVPSFKLGCSLHAWKPCSCPALRSKEEPRNNNRDINGLLDRESFFFFLSEVKTIYLFIFSFIFITWRLITSQHCSGFCHALTWISHGVTCIPQPDPHSHLPLHQIPLGLPSAPAPSTCLMHPTWAGDLFHPW